MKASKKKEKNTQFRSVDKDLLRNYGMEIQAARNSPRQYYSNDGRLKTIK